MGDILEIKSVRPAPDKVDRVEFHPVQPWLAFVTRGNSVTVWNYESDEVGASGWGPAVGWEEAQGQAAPALGGAEAGWCSDCSRPKLVQCPTQAPAESTGSSTHCHGAGHI